MSEETISVFYIVADGKRIGPFRDVESDKVIRLKHSKGVVVEYDCIPKKDFVKPKTKKNKSQQLSMLAEMNFTPAFKR